MKKDLKRKLYALALSGIIVVTPKIKTHAENIDMTPIDIDSAISELVPNYNPQDYTEPTNSNNSNNNNNNSNSYHDNGYYSNNSDSSVCQHLYNENPDEAINFVNPTCTFPGTYDGVYYCIKCGEPKIEPKFVGSLGHCLSDATIENSDENGYDIVRKCQNPGCEYEIVKEIRYSNNIEEENIKNAATTTALVSLGIAGVSGYIIKKNYKKIKAKKSETPKGKYLRK